MDISEKIVIFFDFLDRVVVKCLVEGVILGIFASLAMLFAGVDGLCSYHWDRFWKKRSTIHGDEK
jgi:hypothetical protein